MTSDARAIARWCLLTLAIAALASRASAAPTRVTIDASQPIATVPSGLYGVGYDGWGDIVNPQAVKQLQGVNVRYCRIDVNLRELCGERLGDWRWEYTTPRDVGVGFGSRVRRIIANGWTPILALTTSHSLPKWFRGEASDTNGKPWFHYNLDGSDAPEGKSDQWAELQRVTGGLAAGLAERGLRGMCWETIYEIGHTMPMADIHYYAARGIREADPNAKLMGSATWPGWTVEERFVKPYLAKYGADLLDFVTMHWYADNEHGLWAAPGWKERKGPVTMGDRLFLQYLMETTPKYGEWCCSLRKLLDDPTLNPAGKRIGIVFTEFDALATSPFQQNPENPDWPRYRADADCYINTNYFGGVWCASTLCSLAASGAADIVCKFNTRQFYGLIDNAGKGFCRQPVWFAWKLLQDVAGVKAGATMLAMQVDGPKDSAAAHVGGNDTPWVEAYAVRDPAGPRLILINRSLEPQAVSLQVRSLPRRDGAVRLRRYRFDEGRVARLIGRKPGTKAEGQFEGYPGDASSERCLQPVDEITAKQTGDVLDLASVECPGVSMTILCPAP